MNRVRIAFATGLTTAAALTLAATLPAQAASAPAWRIVSQRHFGASDAYNGLASVVVTGRNNAWALGGTDLSGATKGTPLAEHWNGSSWQRAALPTGLSNELGAASAPRGNDVWAASVLGEYVLHWTGAKWVVARKWKVSGLSEELTGVTAFSASNVWVFGGPGAYPGLGTWHLHGTTWTHLTTAPAGGITAASAVSARNIWAYGASTTAPDAIIAHYNGTTWRQVSSPALSNLQFTGIVAPSAANVWATAIKGSIANKPVLVHFNGTRWQRVAVPWPLNVFRATADGQGGLWIVGDTVPTSTQRTYVLHRSRSDAWSRYLLPAGSGLLSVARIPGTTSAWTTGDTPRSAGGGYAAIWAHGSAG